jgi:hypothetical protein
VGPRAILDGWGKSRPYRDLIPGPSSPCRVAVSLSRRTCMSNGVAKTCLDFVSKETLATPLSYVTRTVGGERTSD